MATRIYPRRRADRRTLRLAIAITAAAALFLILAAGVDRRFGARAHTAPIIPAITDKRVCAAAAVYSSLARDWAQRAATAQAALNRFRANGVADCSGAVAQILTAGLDSYRWQESLDAVDAVNEGTYALPLACMRADTVLPLGEARTQCVIDDMAFAQVIP